MRQHILLQLFLVLLPTHNSKELYGKLKGNDKKADSIWPYILQYL